jgi:F-type H+-transporting ATPase subunit epsilon
MMNLTVQVPDRILIEQPVHKVVAEAENGFFCLKPRHIDFVTALVPGLLVYFSDQGVELFVAINSGILVKSGDQVWVSVENAVCGIDLPMLETLVNQQFNQQTEEEKLARAAAARLEAGIVRRFLEMEKLS